jgi:hypothetical protein
MVCVCNSVMKVSVHVCVRVCVCFGRPLDLFPVEFRVLLLSPHDVNQGGVEKTRRQGTPYERTRVAQLQSPSSFMGRR